MKTDVEYEYERLFEEAIEFNWGIEQVAQRVSTLDAKFQYSSFYRNTIEGVLCDLAQDLDSREVLSFTLKRLLKKKNKISPSTYHYFLGNIYYCRAKSNTRDKTMKSYLDDKYYHKARYEFLNVNVVDEHYSKAITNSAQILNQTGRMWESIELYNTILQKNPNFGMALGSKALALDYYLRQLKQVPYRLIHDIHRLLEKALNDPQVRMIGGTDAVNGFTQKLAEIAELMGEQKKYKKKRKKLSDYQIFCMKNNWYLNLDLGEYYDDLSLQDTFFPNLKGRFSEERIDPLSIFSKKSYICFHIYNELVENYVSSRYLYFLSTSKNLKKYDSDVFYTDTYDGNTNSMKLGLTKKAFLGLYSCLDKMAHLLFQYFELFVSDNKNIYFNDLLKDSFKKTIIQNKSFFLLTLHRLASDFKKGAIYYYLRKIRNDLTHSFLTIKKDKRVKLRGAISYLAEEELEECTKKMFTLTKAAILYFTLFLMNEKDTHENVHLIAKKQGDFFRN